MSERLHTKCEEVTIIGILLLQHAGVLASSRAFDKKVFLEVIALVSLKVAAHRD
jgi:hypothetical protein